MSPDPSNRTIRRTYLGLAILGAVIPYAFFASHFATEGFSLRAFIGALFVNGAAGGFSSDVLISSVVFWVWLGHSKAKRPWVYVLLNLSIGLSCALPAYLFVRAGSSAGAASLPSRRVRNAALLGAVLIASGCSDQIVVDRSLPIEEQWRQDLGFLSDRLRSVHPNLYHSVSRAEFETARAQLHDAIPALSNDEIFVELLRLVALPATQRDGHTAVTYFAGTDNDIVPLKFYRFADGVFVVQAGPEYEDLVGHRLVAIGSTPLEGVDRLIDPLIPRDNTQSLITSRNLTYITPRILHTLGVVADAAAPSYRLAGPDGTEIVATVVPVRPSSYSLDATPNLPVTPAPPHYLSHREDAFWLTHLDATRTLYLRIQRMAPASRGERLTNFGERALNLAATKSVDRLIVDLRHNNGGDNQWVDDIVDILTDRRLLAVDSLLVFTDRQTFSAAGNLVAAIAAATDATFIGVSPGGSGSQFGDTKRFDLPYSGIGVFIPTRHWVFGSSALQPIEHPMDLNVEPSAEDHFLGRDPLLDPYTGNSSPSASATVPAQSRPPSTR